MKLDETPVIGEIGTLPDGLDQPYWDGLANGVLKIQRCPQCTTWIWGPQWLCPTCHHLHPDWVEVEPTGLIYTWTRTWQKFAPEFADHTPYITVLVELPHAGSRRILGVLLGDDHIDPKIGEPAQGVIQAASPLTSNTAILRWQRPT